MPLNAPTDDALMAASCRPGAEATLAFGELWRRHERQSRRLAARICGDRHAEEAIQEASISLWLTRERYRADLARPAAWITHVVKLRAIDVLRRHRRHDARRSDDGTTEPSVDCDAASVVDHRTRIRRAVDGLADLPRAQQEALLLHHGGGFSHTEVAARTGATLGTVKGRLRLGHTALRRAVA